MKRISQFGMVALLLCFLPTLSVASESAVDREKLLKDSGVYATFAVFKMGEHWWQVDHENFLIDLMGTTMGMDLKNTDTFNGITKTLNYVPSFPEELKGELKTPPPQGSPYVIVVPIRKDAEWWISGQDTRTGLMKEHTDATVAYLKTVKRKLYHSSGLDDWDFITYFETSKLDDFNNLVTGLLKVKENRHNRRFGDPLLLGTIRPLDEILDILSR